MSGPGRRAVPARLWLLGLAVRQLRSRPTLAVAQWLTLAAAGTLVASLVLIQQQATDQGVRAALGASGQPAGLTIERDGITGEPAYDSYQSATATTVRAELGREVLPGAQLARSSALVLASIDGVSQLGDSASVVSSVSSYAGLQDHVHLVSGRWPDGTTAGGDWPLTASARATDTVGTPLDFRVGSEYCFQYRPTGRPRTPEAWCGRIAATWLPNDAADPYWGGSVPATDVLTDRHSFFQLAAAIPDAVVSAVQRYVGDPGEISAGNAAQVIGAVNRLRGEFSVSSNDSFISGLDTAISGYLDRQDAASAPTLVLSAGVLAVALAAMAFAALLFIGGHAREMALWRARGWSRGRLLALAACQLGLLAALATPPAAVAAAAVTAMIGGGRSGAAGFGWAPISHALAPAAFAAAGFLAVLTVLAAVTSAPELSRRRSDRGPAGRGWRRRGVDLAMVGGGAAILGFVHLGAGEPGADPQPGGVVLALPLVAAGLVALGSVSIVGAAARMLTVTRSLGGRLARWQVERDPGQYARLCLLVTLAVSVGVFATTYAASDRAAAADRAGYQVGADVRATFSAASSPPQLTAVAATLPAGARSTAVFRGTGRPGRSGTDATVLGIGGAGFSGIAVTRSDYAAQPLGALVATMTGRDPDGLAVPGTPASLSVAVDSSGLDGRLLADLTDATGREVELPFGSLGAGGWTEVTASLSGTSPPPEYPLRLRALRVEVTGTRATGDVALAGLRAGATQLESFTKPDGWWRESFAPDPAEGDVTPSMARPRDGAPSLDIAVDHETVIVQPRPAAAPLPVLLAAPTLAGLGLSLGQPFPLHIDTVDVEMVPVGTFDDFPTYYPARESFIVAPLPSLLGRLGHAGDSIPWANELWIDTSAGTAPVTARLATNLDLTDTMVRAAVESAAVDDPLRTGIRDELTLGFVVALAVVVVGFALHFLAAARTRSTEFAIMRANGVPQSSIRGSMIAEQMVVLVTGLATGILLGLALAWAVVPLFHLGTLPEDLVPPALLSVDPATLAAAVLATGAAALLAGGLVARAGSRVDVMSAVRSLS